MHGTRLEALTRQKVHYLPAWNHNAMKASEIIAKLSAAEGPDRQIDISIALYMGFKRKVDADPNARDGRRVTWTNPEGKLVMNVPFFTKSLDQAYELAQALKPNNIGGCSWEPKMGGAKIGRGLYWQAATPAIALCLAALEELDKKK